MKLIIHDLSQEQAETLFLKEQDSKIIADNGKIHNCIGCFGCWIKTPAECMIKDDYNNMGQLISECDEVIIVSHCNYGGFSPFVKNVLDRSISYIHPYFAIRNREMHHRPRYSNHFDLNVYFYGEDITEKERSTAKKIVQANAINFNCNRTKVLFASKAEEFGGML